MGISAETGRKILWAVWWGACFDVRLFRKAVPCAELFCDPPCAEIGSPLNGKLTVVDGCLTFEIGDLGGTGTNRATLYRTARARPPVRDRNKFYTDGSAPDVSYAQYVLLFEHPSQVTASEDQPGRYWKNYKEK